MELAPITILRKKKNKLPNWITLRNKILCSRAKRPRVKTRRKKVVAELSAGFGFYMVFLQINFAYENSSGYFWGLVFLFIELNNSLDHTVLFAINFHKLRNIPTLGHDKLNLFLWGRSQYLAFPGVNYTLNWLVVSISGIISSWRDMMRVLLFSLLGWPGRSDPIQILLIESPITSNTMLPVLGFEGKIIIKYVLAFYHFSLLPYRPVVATLK
jgi:hypothetical protein